MDKNILITGITGFAGSHLADYILENHKEYNIHGLKRYRSDMSNVSHIEDKINFHDVDITDSDSINKLIKNIKPEKIFHLAAMSYVPSSWENPKYTFDVNVGGTLNILNAVKNYSDETIVQLACSSEEYGMVLPDETPITEDNPLRPLSQYGVSKIAVDMLGYQYNKSYGLKTIRTRAFNHSGPRRNERFIISNFVKQAREVHYEINGEKNIYVGNLEAIRDFTHVEDMVRAYWLSTELDEIYYGDVFNICTGIGYKIKDILENIIEHFELEYKNVVKEDKDRIRPSDVPLLIGDNSKFCDITNWKPQYNMSDIIYHLSCYWFDEMTK